MTLFDITAAGAGAWRAQELRAGDIPALQRFFERNPAYFLAVTGQPPRTDEAHQEFHDLPPPGMTCGGRRLLQFVDERGEMVGMASLLSDFLAPGVWHIGLFIVGSDLHGRGVAPALYRALEAWMAGQGALWIRLGAVVGNDKAERFWRRCGYVEVRQRAGVAMGLLTNALFVFVKALSGGSVAQYLERVPRDRPEPTPQ
jgi:GNAT superfamily N-acetyltransferase